MTEILEEKEEDREDIPKADNADSEVEIEEDD